MAGFQGSGNYLVGESSDHGVVRDDPKRVDILDEDVEVLVAPLQLLLGGVPERQGALELLQQVALSAEEQQGNIHNSHITSKSSFYPFLHCHYLLIEGNSIDNI